MHVLDVFAFDVFDVFDGFLFYVFVFDVYVLGVFDVFDAFGGFRFFCCVRTSGGLHSSVLPGFLLVFVFVWWSCFLGLFLFRLSFSISCLGFVPIFRFLSFPLLRLFVGSLRPFPFVGIPLRPYFMHASFC